MESYFPVLKMGHTGSKAGGHCKMCRLLMALPAFQQYFNVFNYVNDMELYFPVLNMGHIDVSLIFVLQKYEFYVH